jgi:RimJ/RimL family protein N-acetyltransferase
LNLNWKVTNLTVEDVENIVSWRYLPPYDIYNPTEGMRAILLTPESRYFVVRASSNRLIGYCCFGSEGRVPGGEYPDDGSRTLDVGVGMNPELLGRGLGAHFVETVLAYGMARYRPIQYRVTIARFNQRSIRTFQRLGFDQVEQFARPADGLEFIQFICSAGDPSEKKMYKSP